MTGLGGYFAALEQAWAEAQAEPLSQRKALLVAVLLDTLADRVWTARHAQRERVFEADDGLAFRRHVHAECPATALISAVCTQRPDGPRLVTKAVEVAPGEYSGLAVEDYMVSLYNEGTVQRVVITSATGECLAHAVLAEAVAWWRKAIG